MIDEKTQEAIDQLTNLARCSGCDNPKDAAALSVLTKLAEEVNHRCDQRDAALESVGWLTKENVALKVERDDLKKAIALCDYVIDPIRAERDALKAEVGRLTHLHNLDHSLADQWLARAEKAEAEAKDESKRRAAIAESLQAHQDALDAARPLIDAALKAYEKRQGGYGLIMGEVQEAVILYGYNAHQAREGKEKP